ncbi:hypothetical protein Fleli_3219 [Bernardetia litoralis DSM 6794]|uniref:Uncharacterized protein n=1 Tax=Bernardetia litoralis (strain ATCC 23117 / DSM 6794 / NBRC 15988 / NCIMB 1366 / Fx l1 / Sio-4) TaxID=880071 RepID=I4ANL6_BERLS|nr:hypothetical protein [Bernardetia litoralis]AFM05551.1 hypothetical protein Fleli_3219 [Bernardetia litoralis DSM 6794]
MDYGSLLKDLLIITLPAGAVLYGMFLVVKSFIGREMNQSLLELKSKNSEIALPIRLQAYERMAIFLERTSVNNLIPRLTESGQSATDLHEILLFTIREEFNHNVAQQIYISQPAWEYIKSAVEELISIINQTNRELPEGATAFDFSRHIFEIQGQTEISQNEAALQFMKEEIQQFF